MIRTFLIYSIIDFCIDIAFNSIQQNIDPILRDYPPTEKEVIGALHACLSRRSGEMIDDSIGTCVILTEEVLIELSVSDRFFEHVFMIVVLVLKNSFRKILSTQ